MVTVPSVQETLNKLKGTTSDIQNWKTEKIEKRFQPLGDSWTSRVTAPPLRRDLVEQMNIRR